MKRTMLLLAVTASALAVVPALAAITAAPGWVVSSIPTPATVQGAVVRSGDAVIVGQGGFGAGLQSIVRLDAGVPTTIATGFNSLGGFALDGAGTLYVCDNGGNLMGAVTGDTVFAIPNALTRTTPLAAAGAEVVPAGSIPFAQDVAIDGADLIVSDGTGPGAGRVVRVSGGVVSTLITGLDYTAGVVVDGSRLLVGNVDGTFVGALDEYTLGGTFVTAVAGGLSGVYGVDLDNDGHALVSGGFRNDFSSSNVIAIAPGGAISERAWGFAFSTELFHDTTRNETLVLDVAVNEVTSICRDADADAVCDADDACVAPATISRAKLTLSKVAAPAGDDTLKLKGEMTVPTTPALDPVANGVRLVVTDANGTVADVTIPGGTGWKANGSGTVFTFTSKTGVAGIRKVSVKTRPSVPGLVRIGVTGKQGTFATSPSALPLAATFVLDPAGQCGTVDFAGPAPSCTASGSGTTIKCR